MLVEHRRRYIAKALQSRASISTVELARALHVSTETIRRDLVLLEQEGTLRRVYGGAVAESRQRTSEPSFEHRLTIHAEAKRAIGEAAADLVESGQNVFVDVGTTAQAAAKALAATFSGTVVSHSLLVAVELTKGLDTELILAPGRLRRGEWSLSGATAHQFFQNLHFDVAFLGCGGVDASVGTTDFDFDDAEIKRSVARNSKKVFVLADASKHGVVGRFAIADWFDVNGLITDHVPPEGLATAIRSAGGKVHVAPPVLPTERTFS